MEKRIKNIYFVLGLVGIIFAAAGIDFKTLTDWRLVVDAIWSIILNPVAVVSVIMAVCGVFVDPTTPGLKDKKKIVPEEINPGGETTEFRK